MDIINACRIAVVAPNMIALFYPIKIMRLQFEMFVRMLAVHRDLNNSHEITMNSYQARKINELRNVIVSLQLSETFLTVKAEVGIFTDKILNVFRKPCLTNISDLFSKEKSVISSKIKFKQP